MPPKNDGDLVRGLGFVTLYAAYLEEQIDNLLFMLQASESTHKKVRCQCLTITQKIKEASRLVDTLSFKSRDKLIDNLAATKKLFERRNEVVHGRIYATFDRPDTLKSGRPNTPDQKIDADELYDLVNKLFDMRLTLYQPMILHIPNAIQALSDNSHYQTRGRG